MILFADLLQLVKKDIETYNYEIMSLLKKYIHFKGAHNYFEGSEFTLITSYKGTLTFEPDNKIYYHLDDSGENMIPVPKYEDKDEFFNFSVLSGLGKEDIEIFEFVVDLYRSI